MSNPVRLCFLPVQSVGLESLAAQLERTLNRPPGMAVTVEVNAASLEVVAHIWQPILRVRVEDALDDLIGHDWRGTLGWLLDCPI